MTFCTAMKSILDVGVSRFENYHNPQPIDTYFLDWIDDHSEDELVKALREIKDKKERDALKAKLSCVTVSGRFDNPRGVGTLIEHSGLMCIDIDLKENADVDNYHHGKEILGKAPFVAYAAASASGNGFCAVIPIAYPDKHKQHFLAIEQVFAKIGMKIDPACKDVSRLRGRTFDPDPYINHHAKKFTALLEPIKPKPRNTSFRYQHLNGNCTQAAVERRIKELINRRVDLTSSYHDWVTQGFAIASEFGENGRDYFHDISSIHREYDSDECDKQFDKCVKGLGNGVTIASFFYACNTVGIQVGGFTPVEYAQRPAVSQVEAIAKENRTSDNQSVTEKNATNATTLKREDAVDTFDVTEYRQWMRTLSPLAQGESIRLSSSEFPVVNLKLFLTGRLNHIQAFANYREQGNRPLFIRQVQELKSILNNKSI